MENEKPIVPDAPRWKTYPSYIAEEPAVPEKKKKNNTPLSIGIILFQFLLIIVLVAYVLLFTEMKHSTLYTFREMMPASLKDAIIIAQDAEQHQSPFVSELTAMKQQDAAEYESVYSQTLDQAQDMKKKADLSALGIAVNMYYADYGVFPENFPKEVSCIGTDPSCYDLYNILVPLFLEKAFIAVDGSLENTGYSIGTSDDGVTLVTLHATGKNGEIIEVKK